MSGLYQSIPPERRDAYLAHAEQAFYEEAGASISQVIDDMGGLVVANAVNITRAHSGELDAVVAAVENAQEDYDSLTEADRDYLMAHDVAGRRTRGEQPTMSFIEMYAATRKASNPKHPKNIDEEFAQKYQATKE